MMQYFALLVSTVLFPSIAFAVVDVQVFGGGGIGKAKFQTAGQEMQEISFQGSDLGVSLHLNPIESVPISIGVGYMQETPQLTGSGGGSYASFSGEQISVEIMGWLPLNGYAIYGKIGEVVRGSYRAVRAAPVLESGGVAPISDMSYEGKYIALGAGAALSQGVGVFCELRAKINGILVESERSQLAENDQASRANAVGNLTATSFLGGIELGI